jgi:hypothetical protein
MIDFWLNDFTNLFSTENLKFDNHTSSENYIKILNLVALLSIIIGLVLTVVTKKSLYFGLIIIVMSFTILIKSNITTTFFTATQVPSILTNSFDTGVYLVKSVNKGDNQLYVNASLPFNKGDVIALNNGISNLETNIVSDIKYTTEDNTPVIILLSNIKNNYSKYSTKIMKVSDSSPSIVAPPDGNISIQNAGQNGMSDPQSMSVQNYPQFQLPNQNRNDWNLELSTMIPGQANTYEYQGQPYGNLKCRDSSVNNPMGTINITEYDNSPTMFGTCNVGGKDPSGILNDTKMTFNQEATVSQRVDDLLFHKGNSQTQYSPMPVDTLPNDQEGFAHFLYRSPTNLVNPKYASIFVNEPDKFKLVSRLAQATGTENGGGGGGGGRP